MASRDEEVSLEEYMKLVERPESMAAGQVDDGPEAWAVALALGVLALAVAGALLVDGLMH